MNITVSIIDDHPMIIGGLSNMLIDYQHIVLEGKYHDSEQLFTGLKEKVPDVLLLDIQLPGLNGVELAPKILQAYPGIKILTLTNLDSALYIHNMLRLGVHGYVLKTIDPLHLVHAIETVFKGQQFIDPTIEGKLKTFIQNAKKEYFLDAKLTPREKDVLSLIVGGLTGHEIAEKLFVGYKTVEYYRSNLLLKLDAKNMADLVAKALKMGLIE